MCPQTLQTPLRASYCTYVQTPTQIGPADSRIYPMPRAPFPSKILDTPLPGSQLNRRWQKVDRAREYLAGKSLAITRAAVDHAVNKGDMETARWLLAHTATINPEGKEVRPLASSIDRQAPELAQGINVRVGIALGDRSSQPVTVIEGSVSNPQQIGPGSCAEPSQTCDE